MDGHDGGGHPGAHDSGMGGHFGHHDAYGNAEFGGGGHSSWEALSIGFSHQGSNHGHFSGFGLAAHGHHCGPAGSGHASHSHAGSQQQKPNDDRCDVAPLPPTFHGERRMYVAHVVAHGDINIVDHLARICRDHDVVRLDPFRPSLNGEDRTEKELADDEPWLPPYDVKNQPPAGWYPNATGTTRFVKQIWQVGKRPSLFGQGVRYALRKMRKHEWVEEPQYDPDAKTYFEVGIVTWNYRETGDHDTLISIRIASQQIWQRYFGAYGYKKIPFKAHQEAAGKIIQELLDVLKAAVPDERQKRNREFFAVTLPAIDADKGDGTTPAPQPTTPVPAANCPPVPEGEVPGSGVDLGVVIVNDPADAASGKQAPKKVDVVVTIPR